MLALAPHRPPGSPGPASWRRAGGPHPAPLRLRRTLRAGDFLPGVPDDTITCNRCGQTIPRPLRGRGGALMSSPAVPRAVMRAASRKFCAAVRTLCTPPTIAQMTLTGMHLILPIDPTDPVRISDERIGEEPDCFWKLSGTLGADLWIWGPDFLRGDNPDPRLPAAGGAHEARKHSGSRTLRRASTVVHLPRARTAAGRCSPWMTAGSARCATGIADTTGVSGTHERLISISHRGVGMCMRVTGHPSSSQQGGGSAQNASSGSPSGRVTAPQCGGQSFRIE